MRILHTADWHLGRIFHGEHLTPHQARVLEQFAAMARETRPDVIIVAGDVYDRAVPPPDAVALLDETLARLVVETEAHVIVIAGNHDSPERLGFGAALLRRARVHVYGRLDPRVAPLVLEDGHGRVAFHAVPFLEPAHTRAALAALAAGDRAPPETEAATPLPAAGDQAAAMELALAHLKRRHPAGARAVLVAHAMVRGGRGSDSERPLVIGGAEEVPTAIFDPFHYVALGHLHQAQRAGR
ncbi:MAG TPA: exonuclease subunit SbcD, partial [Thermopetrobacter sp.]|nr:exonuclease subunit SbcD [Thermopetrobacter sp.]